MLHIKATKGNFLLKEAKAVKSSKDNQSTINCIAMADDTRVVFSALDNAKTQLYHFKAIVIAGMGFFTDAYDLFCISSVTKLIGRLYYYDPSNHARGKPPSPGTLPVNVNTAITGVALCGTLAGQLFFGWLGDKLGRKKVYGITLVTMVGCALASGLSFGSSAQSVITTLCFFRFWLGFGIDGDYPLSAVIMSEYANQKTRGAFIAAVFAMQGFGILVAGAVSMIVSKAFLVAFPADDFQSNYVLSTQPQGDFVWRIVLMFGAVPAALTYYWRLKMPETPRIPKNRVRSAGVSEKSLLPRLTFFFTNFGLNSTTFVVPAELFRARFRSTCHGISAASGKAGAIIGAFIVQSYTQKTEGIRRAIIALSVVNLLGFCFTLLVPETNGRSLEEISGEDKDMDIVGGDDAVANGKDKAQTNGNVEMLPTSDIV